MDQVAMKGFDKFITSLVTTAKAIQFKEDKLYEVRGYAAFDIKSNLCLPS